MSRKAVVLLSGGMDSAVTTAQAQSEGWTVYALTFDYGQTHRVEVERAERVAAALGVREHRVMRLDLSTIAASALTDRAIALPRGRDAREIGSGIPASYVPARNTIFLSLALAWAETLGAGAIFIGANAVDYSGYPDCRPEFLIAFQELARLATRTGVEGTPIAVLAPLMSKTKADIARLAVEHGVDLGVTLSCYSPVAVATPCGECDACLLRARGFLEAGLRDPADEGS